MEDLAASPFLAGHRFTAADIVMAYAVRMQERPAYLRAMAVEAPDVAGPAGVAVKS